MLSHRSEPILGDAQYVGALSDCVVTLSGFACRRRWTQHGMEISPTRRKETFRAKAGDAIFLWGPDWEATEPVVVVSLEGLRLVVARARRVVADGVVQVVAA